VIVDRDDDDCTDLKERLEKIASDTGVVTRTGAAGAPYIVVNRLAIEELEAWYFGDWQAVQAAYPRVSKKVPRQSKYRDPDAILGGTWETLERVLQRAGYFAGGLRKIEAARAIAPHMNPDRNRSKSFQVLLTTMNEMASQ